MLSLTCTISTSNHQLSTEQLSFLSALYSLNNVKSDILMFRSAAKVTFCSTIDIVSGFVISTGVVTTNGIDLSMSRDVTYMYN